MKWDGLWRLTFDLSGMPKACPLEGMVRRLLRKGLVQSRSDMLDCGFKRCEAGSDMKCSKAGT